MKKHLIQLTVALFALLPAATAMAADYDPLPPPPPPQVMTLPPPPPPPPSVAHLRPASYDWTGGYVGAYAAVACVDGIMTDVPTNTRFLNAGCGALGGALAGYNIQMDQIVFGLEANVGVPTNITAAPVGSGDFNYRYDYIGHLNARVGWALDDTLFFLQGGGAYGLGHLTDLVSTTPTDMQAGKWGWSIGGGIETAVTDNMRLRMDYLFTKFYDTNQFTCATGCKLNGQEYEHEVRAAAIWAF
jgi:outer membrane immunogenic protein